MSDRMQIDDPVLWPYWEGAQRRALLVQRCQACGHHQHYPRPFCLECDHDALDWVETKGQGTVHSSTSMRKSPSACQTSRLGPICSRSGLRCRACGPRSVMAHSRW